MEKRTERNKELYKEINRKIAALAKKSSNEPFKNSHTTLRHINPQLFGEEQEVVVQESKKKTVKNKNLLVGLIFLSILIIAIIIAVVI